MFNCKFCNKDVKTNYSKTFHEKVCKFNLNRIVIKRKNKAIRKKVCCVKCKEEVQIRYFSTHKCKRSITDLKCQFCSSERKNKLSLTAHERICKLNINRQQISFTLGKKGNSSNQYLKAKRLGLPKPKLNNEQRKKLSESLKKSEKNTKWSDERRLKHRKAMKLAVEKYPESYTSSNRGRVKQIEFDGLKFHGNWEVLFYKWCNENNINCERGKKYFYYIWMESEHLYFPDFFLPEYNLWVEVKGFKTDRDICKWEQFPEKILILEKLDIKYIKNGTFKLKV